MLVKKADNYQSWYIEEDGFGILVDPWLDMKLNSKTSILLQRTRAYEHNLEKNEIEKVKAIIITAPFIDHLHLPTLKNLGLERTIYSSNLIKRILKKEKIRNKFENIKKVSKIGPFFISTYPSGFPYSGTSFSFLISNKNRKSIYHEGHILNKKVISSNNIKPDVAILTAESVKLLGLISLSMEEKKTLESLTLLNAKKMMVTGTCPKDLKGLISKFLLTRELNLEILNKSKIEYYYRPGDKLIL